MSKSPVLRSALPATPVLALGLALMLHALAMAAAPWLPWLDAWLRLLWKPLCHQDPSRSLAAGIHWPVCVRCAGIVWGAGLGALLAPWLRVRQWWLGVVLGLTAADVAVRALADLEPGNLVHALVGILLGAAGAGWLMRGLASRDRKEWA